MKTLRTLLSCTPHVAAVAAIALAAPVFAITATPNVIGTADDGMVCRSGYNGVYSNSSFKCSKSRFLTVDLACTRSNFATYVIRPAGSAGTPQGRDICTRSGVSVGSTDSVVALVQGQDYVLAAVDTTALNNQVASLDQQEAGALGVDAAKELDTVASEPLIQPDQGSGSRDRAVVQVTHYSFAVKTGGALSASTR